MYKRHHACYAQYGIFLSRDPTAYDTAAFKGTFFGKKQKEIDTQSDISQIGRLVELHAVKIQKKMGHISKIL
jgi:hypothetical protein